jgi:hypothetical protein
MAGVEDLLDLNRHLSTLQSKPPGWAEEMRTLLTSGFLRRSWEVDVAMQSVDDLIEVIDRGAGVNATLSSEHGWLRGTLAIVVSTCTWSELGNANVQVIRVFNNRTARWKCDYWQETLYTRASALTDS